MRVVPFMIAATALGFGETAYAQRADENAVTAAEDAFGVSVGSERIGIYSDREVRGFSPVTAGNVRVEGVYIDLQGQLNSSLAEGNTIRVGLTALSYPFPAPTGIVDYRLRSGSGGPSISPAVTVGSFGELSLELQGHMPIVGDELTMSGAAALRRNAEGPDQFNRVFNFGLVTRWKPTESVQLTPFWGYSRNVEDIKPVVFVSGFFIPPDVGSEFFGQEWADQDRVQENIGLLGRFDLSESLVLNTGVFRSRVAMLENYSDLYRNTGQDGVADHFINANPESRRASNSGEARLTWRHRSGSLAHTVHAMVRGRQAMSRYGGSASASFGRATVGQYAPVERPNFVFRPQSRDHVEQFTGGIGYEGALAGIGQVSLGVQRSRYEKDVDSPVNGISSITSQPWLFNASGAINIIQRLAVYGGYTRGMEENGTAPDSAANRGQPLPSAITSQREFGFRYALRPGFQIVGGGFELRKPYFSLNSENVFTDLGSLVNRGVEASLAGELVEGLNVVAGAVLMDPQVEGPDVVLGRVGERAVAQTRQLFRANINYRLPFLAGVSLDAGIDHSGPLTASVRPDPATGEQLEVPSRTEVDLGARYRFELRGAPAVLRFQIENVFDVRGWNPTSSGGFESEGPRAASLELAADF
jgi:iron complex outermembrane receptor protein